MEVNLGGSTLKMLAKFFNRKWKFNKCYIRASVLRKSRFKKSNKMEQYADIYFSNNLL
jgi:hypothetical protein